MEKNFHLDIKELIEKLENIEKRLKDLESLNDITAIEKPFINTKYEEKT